MKTDRSHGVHQGIRSKQSDAENGERTSTAGDYGERITGRPPDAAVDQTRSPNVDGIPTADTNTTAIDDTPIVETVEEDIPIETVQEDIPTVCNTATANNADEESSPLYI